MADAGIRWIQVRAKQTAGGVLYRLLEECCEKLEGTEARLWIDDRVDLAAVLTRFDALYGVHVGQKDLPPHAARRVVGSAVRIGLSTHDRPQLLNADADVDVDLIAVGPVFPTKSKAHPDPTIGLDGVRELRAATSKPLVAIGGIDAQRLSAVLDAGADSAVVLGAACLPHPDMKRGRIGAQDLSRIHDGCARLVRIAEQRR